jgi:hypothetical protein
VSLRAKLVASEYVWSWGVRGETGAGRGIAFAQSTFLGAPLDPAQLRKRSDAFVPRLGRRGEAQAWMLARMGESQPLGRIAAGAVATFPDLFPDFQAALRQVADLSEQFSG